MLPDVLEPGLSLVVCGSAVGTKSALKGAYYAGPGNRFWQTLAIVGLTDRQLAPGEFQDLPKFGIGLTDLVKTQAGNDDEISFASIDRPRLQAALAQYKPRFLCFNGKRAAKEYLGRHAVSYGLQPESIGGTKLFIAPSTSGAARKNWDLSVWHTLANLIRETAA